LVVIAVGITLAASSLNLVLPGWQGALASLGLAVVGAVVSFHAVLKVREIREGRLS
jgi:hypothetical protein